MREVILILIIIAIITTALLLIFNIPTNIIAKAQSGFFTFISYLTTKFKELWAIIKQYKTIAILSIVTVIYFAVSMYFIYEKPKLFGKYSLISNTIIMITLFGLLLAIMLEIIKTFRETPWVPTQDSTNQIKDKLRFQLSTISKYIALVVVLFIILVAVTYLVSNYKLPSEIFTLIILLSIVCITIYSLYAYVYTPIKDNTKVQSFISNIQNILQKIIGIFTGAFSMSKDEITNTPNYVYVLLLLEIGIVIAYFVFPYIRNKFITHRGKLLMGKPMYTTQMKTLATYEQLNKYRKDNEKTSLPKIPVNSNTSSVSLADKKSMNYDYHYTVSFWFFPDEQPPNLSTSSNKFTPIFDYGKKPIVLFNPSTSELQVRMKQGIDGEKIIYSKKIKLQRWNNIVVTYDRGTLDLFINGKLVATEVNVVPYMKYDSIVVGYHKDLEDTGVNGGISNVMYYPNILPVSTIQYNYNYFRNSPQL